MRFLSLGLAGSVPDANTIWIFREALKKADAIEILFRRFGEARRSEGFLAVNARGVARQLILLNAGKGLFARPTNRIDQRHRNADARPNWRKCGTQRLWSLQVSPLARSDGLI